jgi:hypothetical protein
MTNDEALARRAAQVEQEAEAAAGGKEHWQGAFKSLARKVESGDLTQAELVQKMGRQTAGGDLFYQGISESDEATWRAWRDAQPNRKRRIEKTR